MKPFTNISPEDFTYVLPEDRIALFPAGVRDQSRLLIRLNDGSLFEDKFSHLDSYLPARTHLFFNNSKVLPARLLFTKETGSQIEIFCLKPAEPADYARSLSVTDECTWECMIGNLKRFTSGFVQMDIQIRGTTLKLCAEKLSGSGSIAIIRFTWNNTGVSFAEILSVAGQTPLPPYIRRKPISSDRERYQTVYSKIEGSVAAPTAGLHFTENVLKNLANKDISCHEITLHVGAGTFQPVKNQWIADHRMHAEYFEADRPLVQLIAGLSEKVSSVGTTTVRTMESLYWIGVKLIIDSKNVPEKLWLGQWEPYSLPQNYSIKQSFEAIDHWFSGRCIAQTLASTQLMIVPGYKFHVVDTLITNFHQPGSSLLFLIAAFIGDSWKEIYDYALDNGFRFLSYGDSSLLFNQD